MNVRASAAEFLSGLAALDDSRDVAALLFKDDEDVPLGQLLTAQERFHQQRSLNALNGVRFGDLEEEVRLFRIRSAVEALAAGARSKTAHRVAMKSAGTAVLSAIHGAWGSSLGLGKKKLASQ
jgi:hypothetical protein